MRYAYPQVKEMILNEQGDIFEFNDSYNMSYYENTRSNIRLTCKKCGTNWTTKPKHLLEGKGCPYCANKNKMKTIRYNTETFKEKAKERHGDKYDYSEAYCTCGEDKVTIICNSCHKPFIQRAKAHVNGQGCPKCNNRYNTW